MKTVKVLMVPKTGSLEVNDLVQYDGIDLSTQLGFCTNITPLSYLLKPQYLYLVSDEGIKDGFVLVKNGSSYIEGEIIQEYETLVEVDLGWTTTQTKCKADCLKIIAAFNPAFTEYCKGVHRLGEGCNYHNSCNYPKCRPAKIPEWFVEAYKKANGNINEVQVEYQGDWKESTIMLMEANGDNPDDFPYGSGAYKVGKDNTVKIELIKT